MHVPVHNPAEINEIFDSISYVTKIRIFRHFLNTQMYTGESEACLTVTLFCINQALIIKLLLVKPENEYEQRINFQKLFYYKKYVWGNLFVGGI
jgi:hypothetical protein